MLVLGTSGLVAAYVLIAVLLLGALRYTRWSWRIKAALLVVVAAFYLESYFSLPPLFGWPTTATLPKSFNLLAIHVQEPDKASGDPGAIFLWATDMAEGPRGAAPRAYRVPFSVGLHEQVVEAGNKMRKGLAQLGELRAEERGPHARPKDVTQAGRHRATIEFFDLPDPLFPEK